jgi:hypothetical protein
MFRVVLCITLCVPLAGCLERRVRITSDPPGALVTANEVELGRTPVEADFTYYGTYDVLVQKDGYEPLRTKAKATTPIYEYPPIDLVSIAIPAKIEKVTLWQFKLEPKLEAVEPKDELERSLVERARAARDMIPEPAPAK